MNHFKDESGQAVTEYILLLSFVIVMAVTMARGILGAAEGGVLGFGARFEKNLKTGRAPLSVWTN